MKRLVYGSIAVIALMATSSAMAAVSNDSLTTKGYVDAGLKYVHDEIVTAVNGDGTTPGLAQQIADKQAQLTNGTDDMAATVKTTVGDATGANAASDTALVTEKAVRDAIDAAVLSAGTVNQGTGITVGSNNTVSVAGLDGTTTDKMYIYKNKQLTELSVATSWATENPTAGW